MSFSVVSRHVSRISYTMNYTDIFSSLSKEARVWVYPVDKDLTPSDTSSIFAHLSHFITNWQSHGRKVSAESAILYNRFIILGAEIPEAEISGCGIDASVHAIESIGKQSGFSLLSGLNIFYRDSSGVIQHRGRSEFRTKVKTGEVTGDTLVLDPSITQIAQLRNGEFELPAKKSWHSTVFRIPTASKLDPQA